MDTTKKPVHVTNQETSLYGQLLRLVVHDIATPVQISTMILKRIRAKGWDGISAMAEFEKLEKVNSTVVEMLAQVRRMLLVAEGRMNLPLVVCNLRDLVIAAADLHEEVAQQKSISIIIKTSSQDLKVLVEPVLFKSVVLANLIQNAMKFSYGGGYVEINCHDSEPGWVTIEVVDNGIGIPEALLPGLFDPSVVTHRQGTKGEAGSGFGLPLVKTFLAGMKGQISVRRYEATENKSTCFIVRLPAQP